MEPPGYQDERSSRCPASGWCRRGTATYSGPRKLLRVEFLEERQRKRRNVPKIKIEQYDILEF